MSKVKACGPSEVNAELYRQFQIGEYGIDFLHGIVKDVWNREIYKMVWERAKWHRYTNKTDMLSWVWKL